MTTQSIYVRLPDHLGDGVMALAALEALSKCGPLLLKGPGWAPTLCRGLGTVVEVVPRSELGVLLKPAFRAAWEARRVKQLVGVPSDHRRALLSTCVAPQGAHRCDEYAAIVAAAGAGPAGLPAFASTADEADQAPATPKDAVLLLPGSASGPVVQWGGYRALADALGGRAVFAGGPQEEAWLPALAGPHPVLPTLPLGVFAAVASRASAVVANDSGLAHLSTAARRAHEADPSKVLVIYGSTSPERMGPPGSTPMMGPRVACAPCYSKRCPTSIECLDLPMEAVRAALSALV